MISTLVLMTLQNNTRKLLCLMNISQECFTILQNNLIFAGGAYKQKIIGVLQAILLRVIVAYLPRIVLELDSVLLIYSAKSKVTLYALMNKAVNS